MGLQRFGSAQAESQSIFGWHTLLAQHPASTVASKKAAKSFVFTGFMAKLSVRLIVGIDTMRMIDTHATV